MLVEVTFFDDVDEIEPAWPFSCVADSEEEPVVVAVCIEIVLEYELVFFGFSGVGTSVGSAEVAAFEVRVDRIFFPGLGWECDFQLELVEGFPVVVQEQV